MAHDRMDSVRKYFSTHDPRYEEDERYDMVTVLKRMGAENRKLGNIKSRRASNIVASPFFGLSITLLIVVDAIVLGYEVQTKTSLYAPDALLLCGFLAEIALEFHVAGWKYFHDLWHCFDYALVYICLGDLVYAIGVTPNMWLRLFRVLRPFRMLRVTRRIKGLVVFQGLWLIIELFLESIRLVIVITILLILLVYCIACVLCTVVWTNLNTREYWPESNVYTSNVFRSVLTIFEAATFDNDWLPHIVRPMAKYNIIGFVFLAIAVALIALGIFNTIIGVMVEAALRLSTEAKELSRQNVHTAEEGILALMVDEIEAVTKTANETTRDELYNLCRQKKFRAKMRLLGVAHEEANDLFDLLDTDHSNTLSSREVCNGLMRLRGPALGADVVALICFAQQQCTIAADSLQRIRNLRKQAAMIDNRMSQFGQGLTKELKERTVQKKRTELVWQMAYDRTGVLHNLAQPVLPPTRAS